MTLILHAVQATIQSFDGNYIYICTQIHTRYVILHTCLSNLRYKKGNCDRNFAKLDRNFYYEAHALTFSASSLEA